MLKCGELDLLDRFPAPQLPDQFGFVEPGHGLSRGGRAEFRDPVGVDDQHVVRAVVTVVHPTRELAGLFQAAISTACKGSSSAFSVDATFQPTMRREYTSGTEDAYANPDHVATEVMSTTQRR